MTIVLINNYQYYCLMKFNVRKISKEKCLITLIPETDQEKKLLLITNEADKVAKADTFEYHYQRAINFKFGPKAHLISFTAAYNPVEVIAGYVIEGPGIG
jgi:hypothetical protein